MYCFKFLIHLEGMVQKTRIELIVFKLKEHWDFRDAENYVIKVKIDFKNQPMTRRGMLFLLVQRMIPLCWHAHFSCKEGGFFKGCFKSCMLGMKWFLTTSAKNNKHGKAV